MSECKKTCACGGTKNFGVKATAEFKAARKIILFKNTADDGTANGFDLTVVWDKTYIDGLKANPDYSKRMQILDISEWNPTTEDDVTVTRPSGKVVKVRDGVTTYEVFKDGSPTTIKEALDGFFCDGNNMVAFVDDCGSVAGIKCDDMLQGMAIGDDTFQATPLYNNDSDIERLRIRFNLDLSERKTFDVVKSGDIEFSANSWESLYDGELVEDTTVNSTIQVVAKLQPVTNVAKTNSGNIPLKGADTPANWTITDSTGATSVSSAVAESPDGTYTIDYAAIATGVATFHYLDNTFEVIFTSTIA